MRLGSLGSILILLLVLPAACSPSPVQPETNTPFAVKTETSVPVPAKTAANSTPADFEVRYHWQEGSLPPPYHYEYDINIGPGTNGEIVYTPSYASKDVPVWTVKLDVTDGQLSSLYALVVDKRILSRDWQPMKSPPIGGSSQSIEITAIGKRVSIPSYPEVSDPASLNDVYTAIRAFVPQALWTDLEARRDKFREEYKKAH